MNRGNEKLAALQIISKDFVQKNLIKIFNFFKLI